MNDIHHIPGWAQVLTGIALIAGSTGAALINKRLDKESAFLDIAAVVLGVAGLLVLYAWLGSLD